MSRVGTAGLAAMGALTAATVSGIEKCTGEAEKLESAMSDVVRYAEGLTDANNNIKLDAYEKMRAYIQDLSTEIPRTTEQIAAMSAALGQSGKSAQTQMSTGILRDAAVAATAMDLDDQTAGEYMAKWEEAFKFSHDQVMNLMDQINYLGANNATTAAEIAQSVNSAASMGQIAGVDPAATAALATAMQATGVSADRVGTTISRIYTNISKGANATAAQKELWEELGYSAEGIAKAMQTDGIGTLQKVFAAINEMPDERKVAALTTLFGQWAIEGGAKVTQNLELLQKTLDEVSDASLYTGSMNKEFLIEAGTTESIDTMLENAKLAVMQDVGNAFLPAKKELGLALIDFYNRLRENAPELEKLAESLGNLASRGVQTLGESLEWALPHIREILDYLADDGVKKLEESLKQVLPHIKKLFEYLVSNGDKVVDFLTRLPAIFAAMKAAPLAGKILSGTGKLLFGSKSTSSGIGSLIGTGGIFGSGGVVDAAKTGAAMANSSMTRVSGELITNTGAAGTAQKVYNSIVGGTTGVLNRKKLFATGVSNATAFKNVAQVSGKIATAKTVLPGVAKALGSGATTTAGAAAVGAGSVMGAIAGAAGVGSGIADIYKGAKSEGKDQKDKYYSGGTKIGMVGAGAAAGAAIGAAFGGIGAVPGALIGAGVGGVAALLEGKNVGEALSDATDEGGWLSNLCKSVGTFFTEGLPTWWNGVTQTLSTFFTQTIPEKWAEFWDGVKTLVTEKIPYALGYAAGKVQIFFTRTLPEKWTVFWTAIGNFFTETLPNWVSDTWNNRIVPFFTETIPEKWTAFWTAIGNFFTETLPTWASDTWSNHIVPFFTEDIPQFFKDLWKKVKDFFNETLPNLATQIWGSIKSFFTETIPGFFSGLWGKISGSASAGYAAATEGVEMHASGGIFTTPHLGMVAEAGAESIIPLSAASRSRGIGLWMQTGRMLGVLDALNGGGEVTLKPVERSSADADSGSFSFAPSIVIQGSADKDVLDEALRRAREEFETWYEQMMRRRVRTAY